MNVGSGEWNRVAERSTVKTMLREREEKNGRKRKKRSAYHAGVETSDGEDAVSKPNTVLPIRTIG